MRRGLAVDRGGKGQNDFGYVFSLDPVKQLGDAQFVRANSIKGGKRAAQARDSGP